MEFHIAHILHKTNFLTILFTIFLFKQTLSQYHHFYSYCDETIGNYTDDDSYKSNLDLLLPKLTSLASLSFFDNYTVGDGIDKAYGLYLCRGDLTDEQCQACVKEATISITKDCPVEKEAVVWYDECIIRYANRSIFSLEDETFMVWVSSPRNVSDPKKFGSLFEETVLGSIMDAAYNKTAEGYSSEVVDMTSTTKLYVMAQCTPDIVGDRCERCLRVALRSMGGCCGAANAYIQMYLPSCWLRYDTTAPIVWPMDSPPSASPPRGPIGKTSSGTSSDDILPPPPPKGKSGGTSLSPYSPTWITSFVLFLLMFVGIPNNCFV